MEFSELVNAAVLAKRNAYAPYSGFKVGAAVLTSGGKVFTGVNIENASYGAACCAERTAIYKAVAEGETGIKAIAVASDKDELIYPCGICRQVISEFADDNTVIICSRNDGTYKVYKASELLPNAFTRRVLENGI